VELTVLGTSGTWPPAGGATCGYLVSHEGTHMWVDAGTGTFANLQEHISVSEMSAILITHGHPDHFVDMLPCFYARHYGGLGPPNLPFFSPKGFVDLAALLVSEDGRDVMRQAYAFNTVHPRDVFEVGPFRVTVFEMTHIGVESLGFRIEADGAVLAYTGDSGPSPEVVELARDADVFLAEATYQDHMKLLPFHMSAAQAGEHATAANVGRLLLTHILPGADREVSRAEGAATFHGEVDVVAEGEKITVGE
jgi:ribonuclease BN (tRNA processing enzyme)